MFRVLRGFRRALSPEGSGFPFCLDGFGWPRPWWYLNRNILDDGIGPEAIVAPLAVAAILVVLGLIGFRRRDLH